MARRIIHGLFAYRMQDTPRWLIECIANQRIVMGKFHYGRISSNKLLKQNLTGRSQSSSTMRPGAEDQSACPICSRNLTFTYKDVLLLSQFISPEGNILNRRVTGVCRRQQRKLEKTIRISRRLGLIPRKPPALIQQENEAQNSIQNSK